jgi:hypothetical protein
VSGILNHHAQPARPAVIRASAGTVAASLAIAVAACGSSPPRPPATAALGATVAQGCTAIGDVLSDGPDPDADSIGYAEAQVLPLRQLAISDPALHRDVLALASAYQAFSTGSGAGSPAEATAVAKAENSVNSICPQAAP